MKFPEEMQDIKPVSVFFFSTKTRRKKYSHEFAQKLNLPDKHEAV